MDPIEQLNAAIDEDERIAREALADEPRWEAYNADREYMEDPWVGYRDELGTVATGMRSSQAIHIARQDPRHILDRVAADREILAFYEKMLAQRTVLRQSGRKDVGSAGALLALHEVVKLLVKGYGIDTSGSARVAAIVEEEDLPY